MVLLLAPPGCAYRRSYSMFVLLQSSTVWLSVKEPNFLSEAGMEFTLQLVPAKEKDRSIEDCPWFARIIFIVKKLVF